MIKKIKIDPASAFIRLLLVCSLILGTAGPLFSESLSLTTTYPSPAGVYGQIITTGVGSGGATVNTQLATAAGAVVIGGTLYINSNVVAANSYQRFSLGYGASWDTANLNYTITDPTYNQATFSNENGTFVWTLHGGALTSPQTYAAWHAYDRMSLDNSGSFSLTGSASIGGNLTIGGTNIYIANTGNTTMTTYFDSGGAGKNLTIQANNGNAMPFCFSGDTRISVTGGYKLIRDLAVGDSVVSYDVDKKKESVSTVQKLIIRQADSYFILNNLIKVTAEHPFYTKRGWVKVVELKIGDELFDGQNWRPLAAKQEIHEKIEVFNLSVTAPHTYFAENILVHNKGVANFGGNLILNPGSGGDGYGYVDLASVSGNVGIGQASPANKLHVNGNIETDTGYFYQNNGNVTQMLLDSFGSDWGTIQNDTGNVWSLGHKAAVGTALGTPVLSWTAGGNVGIGNATGPTATLYVNGNMTIKGASSTGFYTQLSGLTDTWLRLAIDTNRAAYHDLAVGRFYANGSLRYDIAEVTPVDASENLLMGELVSPDPAHSVRLHRARTAYDPSVVGIVSNGNTASMVIGGDIGPEAVDSVVDKRPIALGGRVVTIVNLDNGPIQIGDPITVSLTPGTGMRATKAGGIVAKALESFDASTVNASGVQEIINRLTAELAKIKPSDPQYIHLQKTIDQMMVPLPKNAGRIVAFISVGYYAPDAKLADHGEIKELRAEHDKLETVVHELQKQVLAIKGKQ
jgi:hypothetical protein